MIDRKPALEQSISRIVNGAAKMSAYLRSYDLEGRSAELGRMFGMLLAQGMTPEQRIAANTRVATAEEGEIVAKVGRILDKLAVFQGKQKIDK